MDEIDRQAEREAMALRRQGKNSNQNNKRNKIKDNYNRQLFEKLFRTH
uniref:Uncharacterized protein n=1 Tax=viral metagenome TaxID=1070528 RepID=A0A6M3LAW6_9ZZZZ